MPKIKVTIRSKSCLSNYWKTTEANLMKLHRKIEHNEKVGLFIRVRFLCIKARSQSGQRPNCA